MKKSELKQLIRRIVTEVKNIRENNGAHPGASPSEQPHVGDDSDHDDSEPMFEDKKLGVSSMKKVGDKKDNTQMGYEDKTITSTTNPTEKKEGKKLPVVQKKSNTETNHFTNKKTTSTVPSGERKEGKSLPVGGHGAKGLKEEILSMIRESLDEMAKTPITLDPSGIVRGGVPIQFRVQDKESPTGWSLKGYTQKFPDGTPVEAPKNTGANYKKVGTTNTTSVAPDDPESSVDTQPTSTNNDPAYTFTFIDPSGAKHELDPELPWYGQNQLNSYLEKNVMANVGNLSARLDPTVVNLLSAIKVKPETVSSSDFTLKYDPASKTVKINPIK